MWFCWRQLDSALHYCLIPCTVCVIPNNQQLFYRYFQIPDGTQLCFAWKQIVAGPPFTHAVCGPQDVPQIHWQNDPFLSSQTFTDVDQQGRKSQIPPWSLTIIKLSWPLSLAGKKYVSSFLFKLIFQEGSQKEWRSVHFLDHSRKANQQIFPVGSMRSQFFCHTHLRPGEFLPWCRRIKNWLPSQPCQCCRDDR